MASRKVNEAKAKAKKQKIIAIGGGVLLVAILAFEIPNTMKLMKQNGGSQQSSSQSAAATTTTTVSTTPAAGTPPADGSLTPPTLSGSAPASTPESSSGLVNSDPAPAAADGHQVAQTQEEVGEVVEVPGEVERDRDHLVSGERNGVAGLDRLEGDARVLGDLVQLQQDPGHVLRVRHGLDEPEEVRDADRLLVLRGVQRGLSLHQPRVGGRDVLRQLPRLRALRMHEAEPADGRDEEHHDDGDHDLRGGRDLLLRVHEAAAPARTLAAIWNWTIFCVPSCASVLFWSCTLDRSGRTSSRESSRATPACEYV